MSDFYSWLITQGVCRDTASGYNSRVQYFNHLRLSFSDFVKLKKDQSITNNTINAYVKALRKYGEFIDNAELRSLPYLKKNESRVSTLTDEEIEQILSADPKRKEVTLFFMILAYTGMRPVEVNGLLVSDIDFRANQIRILATKTQTYRTIPIPLPLFKPLQQHCNGISRDKVFRGYNHQYLYSHFHKRREMAGIKRKNLHVYSLRHSYATRMVDADCDPFSVKELLGHKDIHMTERYYHLSAKRLQKVSKRDPLAKAKQCPIERIKTLLNEIQPLLEGFIYDLIQNDDAVILKIKKPLPEAPNRG